MAGDLTMDELRAQQERDLGLEAGPIYSALCDQVRELHTKWYQYSVLYSESDANVAVLNEAAPFLFGVLQDVLWRDAVLHIARLLDRSRSGLSGSQENLSLEALVSVICDAGLKAKLGDLLAKARTEGAFAKTWRDKNLAHLDRAYTMGTSVKPLPDVSEEKVKSAMEAVGAVLNGVARHRWGTHIDFTPVVMDDARGLLHFLRTGLEAHKSKHQPSTDNLTPCATLARWRWLPVTHLNQRG